MKTVKTGIRSIYILLLSSIIFIAGTGCSYVSDAVEGAITDRSAFSINAYYNSATEEVTITWDETGGKNFAGYEIYITEEQDDEYIGYKLVASKWRDGSGFYMNLDGFYTYSFTHDVSGILSGSFPYGPGKYFYRVGIIEWDDDLVKRTASNGYSPPYDPNNPNDTSWDSEINYNSHTDIDKISGFTQVEIRN